MIGVGLVISYVVALVVSDTPAATVVMMAVTLGPSVVGMVVWRLKRRPWRDIASWTLPLAVWMLVADLGREMATIIAALAVSLGTGFAFLLIVSDDLATEWQERVLGRGGRPDE